MPNRSVVMSALLVAGCWGGSQMAATPETPTPAPAAARPLLTIERSSVGPITGATPADLETLRELLAKDGLTVEAVDRAGIELHVSRGDELVMYVIPNDDGSLFNVHVVSPNVAIAEHPRWKIGAAFTGDEQLTHCECWGEHPVCFRRGDHVAVAFQRACDGLDDQRMRRVLAGLTIQRVVWSPQPFGYDHEAGYPDPDDPFGSQPTDQDAPLGDPWRP